MESTIGKSLPIQEQKTKLKLVSHHQNHLIITVLSVIIHSDGLIMVIYIFYLGLGQLRHGSNATGAAYGKRFKKDGILGILLDMNKGTLSFALNG